MFERRKHMKPNSLNIGDKVAIVSLSSGALGEDFAKHELDLGLKRIKELELEPVLMPNALKGIKYILEHPEKRAEDLIEAFKNPEIKAIICAIGGTDTYKTIPYIMSPERVEIIKNNPKIFIGYSDSTINHLTLASIGLNTFYGPAFLTDFAELDAEMLPYTKYWLYNLFVSTPNLKLESSEVWYDERTDFSPKALGTPRNMHLEELGYASLCRGGTVTGKLFGGCLESIYSIIEPENSEQKKIFEKYNILQANNNGKILFLETSDEKIAPDKFEEIIKKLKSKGFFDGVQGVLFGKPQNEQYMHEYMNIVKKELADYRVMFNLNFGHAFPHCIMPYNIETKIDFDKCEIEFVEPWFADFIENK